MMSIDLEKMLTNRSRIYTHDLFEDVLTAELDIWSASTAESAFYASSIRIIICNSKTPVRDDEVPELNTRLGSTHMFEEFSSGLSFAHK